MIIILIEILEILNPFRL